MTDKQNADTDMLVQIADVIGPLIIIVSREEVLAGDTASTLGVLNRLFASRETILAYKEKVDIAFDGYNDDARELFEITEVRDFVLKLDDAFPYWLFFLSKQHLGLQCLLWCLLPPFLSKEGQA